MINKIQKTVKPTFSKKKKMELIRLIESSRDSSLNLQKSRNPLDIAEMIIKIVEHLFHIPRAEFTSQSRDRDYVIRRCLVVNLISIHTNFRESAIGEYVNRDRVTVYHMFKLHEDLMYSDPTYRDYFQRASSLYARANFFPSVQCTTIDEITEKIIKLNEEMENLNEMLGVILTNTKSSDDTESSQSLTD